MSLLNCSRIGKTHAESFERILTISPLLLTSKITSTCILINLLQKWHILGSTQCDSRLTTPLQYLNTRFAAVSICRTKTEA